MEKEINLLKPTPEEAASMKLDIYIIAGQSNASGSSKIDIVPVEEQDLNTYPNVRYYGYRVNVAGNVLQNETDLNPVHQGLGAGTNAIGPELGMARVLNPIYAGNERKAILLKVAAGGTSLLKTQNAAGELAGNYAESSAARFFERGSWLPEMLEKAEVKALGENRPTGFLTRELKRNARKLYEKLLDAGYKAENVRFISVSWMQGEDDRARREEYPLAMGCFMAEIRDEISTFTGADYSRLPFVIGEVSRSFASKPSEEVYQKNAAFIAMQDTLPDRFPAVTVVPTGVLDMTRLTDDGYEFIAPDGMHWHYRDMLKVGELFAEGSLHPEKFAHTSR